MTEVNVNDIANILVESNQAKVEGEVGDKKLITIEIPFDKYLKFLEDFEYDLLLNDMYMKLNTGD